MTRSDEMELPKQIVVLNPRTLTLDDLDENIQLVVNVHHERLSILSGKKYRSLRSMIMTSPVIFKPIVKRVPSKSNKSCTCEDPSKGLQLAQLHQSKILLATEKQLALVDQLFQLEGSNGRRH